MITSAHGIPSRDITAQTRGALLSLRQTTNLPIVFGGAVARAGQLRLTELIGNTTDSLRGLAVRPGLGVGGKAIALGRPVRVSDYPNATTISHDYDGPVATEGLLSLVCVPVVVRRQVRAVLYGALREPVPLSDRIISAAVDTARDLEQDLAVHDEARSRLARLQSAGNATDRPSDPSATARWEEIRHLNVELRRLAEGVADADLKGRLLHASTRLASAAGPDHQLPAPRQSLSRRELDVLAWVAIGYTNADTAHQLGLLPETVKSYLRSAMRKLGSHTRLEAVAAARLAGLLP